MVGFEPNLDDPKQLTMLTLTFEDDSQEDFEVYWECDLEVAEAADDEAAVEKGAEWLKKKGADKELIELFKEGGVTASGTDKYHRHGGKWCLN